MPLKLILARIADWLLSSLNEGDTDDDKDVSGVPHEKNIGAPKYNTRTSKALYLPIKD